MLIDRNNIEAMIIFAYKLERFELVQELLNLLKDMEPNESYQLVRRH